MVVVRHPELSTTIEIADRCASELHLYAPLTRPPSIAAVSLLPRA